ncbi:MAG TPA: hypothetical protein VHA06_07725 [Candidatus Angelobacter sp.]|jgi:trans-aconitate methyltransferase|nr:hypothetical protein [Candidatus Angelobacter sp.]
MSAAHVEKWDNYLKTRKGTYQFRAQTRYKGVAEMLVRMGLSDDHLIVDVGAGSCHFDHYLRTELGWNGRYLPIDAVIDGTDLETWEPRSSADFMVAIEVVEHLHNSAQMLGNLRAYSRIGSVITTPNPEVVDVLGCDPTHVSVITRELLQEQGWIVSSHSFFHQPHDTLLATSPAHLRQARILTDRSMV